MPLNAHPVTVATPARLATEAAPIPTEWIIAGTPKARAATVARSPDNLAVTVMWECSAGTFRWRFDEDETVYVVAGGVIIHWQGNRYVLGPGDVAYFPRNSITTWVVSDFLHKVAFIRVPPPVPLGIAHRAFRKLAVMLGRAGLRKPAAALTSDTV